MKQAIRLQLLNNRPRITLDGVDIHVPDSSLDLFIYVAVENQTDYDRDALTLRLYESLEYRESFRKTALRYLPKSIKDRCIGSTRQAITYDDSNVYVDTHDLQALVEAIPENYLSSTFKQMLPRLTDACELYQDDFLSDYTPQLFGLNSWIREKRTAFRTLYHRLLETLAQYHIATQNYDEARSCAERWHQNAPEANLPLQYLIWLAANLDAHSMMETYLSKLASVDTIRQGIIGYSPAEWWRIFERGIKPDASVLRLNTTARIEIQELLEIATSGLPGREEPLEHVFDTLFVSQTASLLTITGERGIGKTAMAEAVVRACDEVDVVDRIFTVGVTASSDFEQVLNAVALQAGEPQWLDQNYRSRYLNVEQLFEAESTLLILDQQEVGDIFSEEFKTRVKALSEHAATLICCHEAWDGVHDIPLGPLDSDAISTLTGAPDAEAIAETLLAITGGSPLALNLLVNSIKTLNLTIAEAAAQFTVDATSSYRKLLHWCWHALDLPTRQVLASLQDFDLLEGPTVDDLYRLHDTLPAATVDAALQQLSDMTLISLTTGDDPPHYRWHSLLHEFLVEIDALSRITGDPHFKARFHERFCNLYFDYLARHADDYPQIDLRQRTLLRAFELAPAHPADVNRFAPYLVARGLYDPARQLLEQAAHAASETDHHIELLLNTAKLDIKQGELQAAEQRLNEALRLSDASSHEGEIYHQLGNLLKIQGQYEPGVQLLERALHHARIHEDSRLMCMVLANLGGSAVEHGDYDAAQQYLEESLRIARTIDQFRVVEFAYTALGTIATEHRLDFALALDYLAEAQVIARQNGSPERQAYIYLNSGAALINLKRYADARQNLENGLEIAGRLRHEALKANLVRNLGRVEAAQGNLLAAEQHYKTALQTALDYELRWLAADVLLDMGKISFQAHNSPYARRIFEEALARGLDLLNYDLVAEALFGLGMTTADEAWLIAPDDVQATIQLITDTWEPRLLERLPELPVTPEQFHKAAFFFQQRLVNFPDIQPYRVAEALAHLTGTDTASEGG